MRKARVVGDQDRRSRKPFGLPVFAQPPGGRQGFNPRDARHEAGAACRAHKLATNRAILRTPDGAAIDEIMTATDC